MTITGAGQVEQMSGFRYRFDDAGLEHRIRYDKHRRFREWREIFARTDGQLVDFDEQELLPCEADLLSMIISFFSFK